MYRIGGRLRSENASFVEPPVGYHSYVIEFLTCIRNPDEGQCQAGSLTGAVAS